MADESDDGTLGAPGKLRTHCLGPVHIISIHCWCFAATEHLDMNLNLMFHPDIPKPPSDQIEVVAAVANQVEGPDVMPTPKVMTPISCLKEICVARKLSIPKYQFKSETKVAHMSISLMEVWVPDMDLRGTIFQ